MLHDPKAFAHVRRKMRAPVPVGAAEQAPPIAEMIRRVEAMMAARTPSR